MCIFSVSICFHNFSTYLLRYCSCIFIKLNRIGGKTNKFNKFVVLYHYCKNLNANKFTKLICTSNITTQQKKNK